MQSEKGTRPLDDNQVPVVFVGIGYKFETLSKTLDFICQQNRIVIITDTEQPLHGDCVSIVLLDETLEKFEMPYQDYFLPDQKKFFQRW